MEMIEYEHFAASTAVYPNRGSNIDYALLGLGGEVGEMLNKRKKQMRDSQGKVDQTDMVKELGDVLWYVAATAHELGVSLEEVARCNVAKLTARKRAGTLQGYGDNR